MQGVGSQGSRLHHKLCVLPVGAPRDFSGGPVVGNPPVSAGRGVGFDPWSGRIPHAAGQPSVCALATEPEGPEPVPDTKRSRHSEKPTRGSKDPVQPRQTEGGKESPPSLRSLGTRAPLAPRALLSHHRLCFLALRVNLTSLASRSPLLCHERLSFKTLACCELLKH